MTDAELSLAIARHLELKPDYRPQITGHLGLDVIVDRSTDTLAWRYHFKSVQHPDAEPRDFTRMVDASEWQPRDMVNDAEMTLLLMKRGPVCVTRCKKAGLPNGWTAFVADFTGDPPEWPVGDNPQRVVAEAFYEAFARAEGVSK